jgi:hypothetical protein
MVLLLSLSPNVSYHLKRAYSPFISTYISFLATIKQKTNNIMLLGRSITLTHLKTLIVLLSSCMLSLISSPAFLECYNIITIYLFGREEEIQTCRKRKWFLNSGGPWFGLVTLAVSST